MKKRKIIVLIIILILTVTFIMGIITINKSKTRELKVNDNHIAIMVQNDSGDGYHLWDKDTWPSNGYAFEKGTCNSGETIEWDAEHQLVTLSGKKTDKCTLYFAIKKPSIFDGCANETDLVSCLKSLDGLEKDTFEDGDGFLYHHTLALENGAEDGGYRYAGNQPNNYICFGSGSEGYNNGTDTECPLTNKYRIIGLVPVETKNNGRQTLVKIIKAEYITADELGISSTGTVSSNSSFTSFKKIEGSATSVPGFHWNNSTKNTWDGSSLYNALNGKYLTNLKDWQNKVETVKWNVGGWNDYNITPKAMYDGEMTNSGGATGSGTIAKAKVGLMYVHDYGFASIKDSWTSTLYNYGSNSNRQNNWLFNGVYEWTISRHSSIIYRAFYVLTTGLVVYSAVNSDSDGVRPVLYLTSDVKLGGGAGIDGSITKPYKVS